MLTCFNDQRLHFLMPTFSKILSLPGSGEDDTHARWTTRRLGVMATLVAVYFIAGKLGLRLAVVNSSTTAIWPPTGIAIAAALLLGYDALAAVFAAAFLVNITTTGSIVSSLGIAFGNTLEAFIAAYLVNKYANGREAFESAGDVFRFAILAGLMSTMVAASIGVLTLFAAGYVQVAQLGPSWFTWWLGDAGGALIFAPFIILLAAGGRYRWRAEDNVVAGVFLLFSLIAAGVIFDHLSPQPFNGYPLAFLVVPPLLWAAYRFGRRVTASTTVVLSIVAVVSTFNGPATMGASGMNNNLLFLQFFLSFVSVSNLMFAVAVYQQRKGERAVIENERRFRTLVENSSDGIAMLTARGVVEYASPAIRHILGYEPAEVIGHRSRELVFPEDKDRFAAFAKNFAAANLPQPDGRARHFTETVELRMVSKSGGVRWLEFAVADLLDDPAVAAIVVNFRDITERKQAAAAKNNFISSVSYRLSPPLAQAETYIAALRERKRSFSPLEQKYLDELDAANQKMITLTSDIIRLARIELGTIRTSPRVLDLRKLAEEALQGITGKAQSRGIQVSFKHPPGRTFIMADQNLLSLALQRLAVKLAALAPNEGNLELALERGDAAVTLRFLILQVRDLRNLLQMKAGPGEAEGDKFDAKPDENEFAYGFYMIRALIELMQGKLVFERNADGIEMLAMQFPQPGGTAAEEAAKLGMAKAKTDQKKKIPL